MNEVIMEFRQNYTYGYIVEYIPENHTRCSSWILVPGENLWLHTTRGVIYIIAMLYIFLGIAIVSDLFMSSIEVITSQKKTVYKWDEERQERIAKEVMVWNETVANLTLLALGSSAPEILLATIENVLRLGDQSGEKNLGTFTIVGSAAFNLLMITSVCISSLPNDKVKKIKTFGVFITTSIWSLWAYIWMYIVTAFISPGVVTIWEAWVTFLYFPAFVLHAYAQDNGWWICKRKKQSPTIITEDPPSVGMRVVHHTNVHAAMHAGKMQRVPSETSDDGRSVVITCTEIEPTSGNRVLTARRSGHEPQAFARARSASVQSSSSHASLRFRHAAFNVLLGRRKTTRRHSAGQIEHVYIGDDCQGYFLFASEKYSIFEGGGVLEVDVLFARALQIPDRKKARSNDIVVQNSTSADAIPNCHQKKSPKSTDSINLGTGLVSVDYETRESSAKAGVDFRPITGTLVFREDEYRKQISVDILSDGYTTNTIDFFLILKNPSGNAGLGDPSVAHIVVIGRHEPGEFLFESAYCHADMKKGSVTAIVHREGGFDSTVSVQYQTMDGTACGGNELGSGVDYIATKDVLTFADGEITKAITIDVNMDVKICKNFIIVLSNPDNGARIGERSAVVCFMNNDELAVRLGEAIEESEEESMSWFEQITSAMEVGGDVDMATKAELMWYDYILHFLTFFWKVIIALLPPTSYCNGWVTFISSLTAIGVLTAFVEQLGNLLGCVVGLKQSVTGITIIALGTSLPDTFASRTAAKHDSNADAAIGNITGSNSVNVFLGLGLPWVICSMYYTIKGESFLVTNNNLASSVTLFTICGVICITLLVLRRLIVGGELGGSWCVSRMCSLFLFLLWVTYICIIGAKSYDVKILPWLDVL
ncbi:sodium/calcium exchanger 2-like isoform X4 [Octopus sinensis]|uniref:Sodium/calcium exchanger 2-like isoform X4 n=1 Tax=Octopus sinensis TaxID=2607531 RepID=A0A7E6F7J7_9MOLL|nr:sodium/calcium exchanger 2-like isoform X4 [Octopus sinensis]